MCFPSARGKSEKNASWSDRLYGSKLEVWGGTMKLVGHEVLRTRTYEEKEKQHHRHRGKLYDSDEDDDEDSYYGVEHRSFTGLGPIERMQMRSIVSAAATDDIANKPGAVANLIFHASTYKDLLERPRVLGYDVVDRVMADRALKVGVLCLLSLLTDSTQKTDGRQNVV